MDGPAYQQVFCLPNILQKFVGVVEWAYAAYYTFVKNKILSTSSEYIKFLSFHLILFIIALVTKTNRFKRETNIKIQVLTTIIYGTK